MNEPDAHPDLDHRTRAAIARVESEVASVIAEGNADELASQLSSIISWQRSLENAIAEQQDDLQSLQDDSADPDTLIALQAMGGSFSASLEAAEDLRRRLEGQLGTVT